MSEEKTETTTEETTVEKETTEKDGAATTETSVEKSTETETSETDADDAEKPAQPDVNVNIKQEFSGTAAAVKPDPHTNYEAAQPVVDPIV